MVFVTIVHLLLLTLRCAGHCGCSCSSGDGDKLTRGHSETSHIYAVNLQAIHNWTGG